MQKVYALSSCQSAVFAIYGQMVIAFVRVFFFIFLFWWRSERRKIFSARRKREEKTNKERHGCPSSRLGSDPIAKKYSTWEKGGRGQEWDVQDGWKEKDNKGSSACRTNRRRRIDQSMSFTRWITRGKFSFSFLRTRRTRM